MDIKELNLEGKALGNKILDYLKKIEFKELKELNLYYTQISDIKALENAKFEKLEKLNLSDNKISDINVLEKSI